MNKRLVKILVSIAVVVAGAVLYLLTLGHCFLPFGAVGHYKNERPEFWFFSPYPLVMPSSSQTIAGTFDRLAWSVKNPGMARLLAIAKRLEMEAPNEDHGLKELLEKMGYPFPTGCSASSGRESHGWRVTHYPSMLRRIQKDFRLKVTWRVPCEGLSPNPQGAANGRQPFSPETNRTSSAAASRRSP
jgi:hypothetical protein